MMTRALKYGLLALGLMVCGVSCIGGGQAPTLYYPSDGDTISGEQIVFSWSAVETAGAYRIEISSDSSMNSIAVSADDITTTSYTLDIAFPDSPLDGKKAYYWHAAAYTDAWGPWSEAASFYNDNPKNP